MRKTHAHASVKRPNAVRTAPTAGLELLEGRQLFSVTGFSLVNQVSFPAAPTTVVNQPTIFRDQITHYWQSLVSDQTTIQGQTIQQLIAAGINAGDQQSSGQSAYNISSSLNTNGVYNGFLKQTAGGPVLEVTYDVMGNHTTFTSTTGSILGSYADPTFHISYDLTFTVDLSLPSNLNTGKVSATAKAGLSNVTVSTNNILVGVLKFFGNNIPQKIANGINGNSVSLAGIVPTNQISSALSLEALQGYTHLHQGLDSAGNLLLTAQKPTLTVTGDVNNHFSISAGVGGSVIVTSGSQTQIFDPGFLKTIIVKPLIGTNTVSIPSLPAGISVQVQGAGGTDSVVVGGSGSLANVAGTVSVSNTSGNTSVTVNDLNDPAASSFNLNQNAVQFQGRTVVTYTHNSDGHGVTALTVESGAHGATINVNGTTAGVTNNIQTNTGTDKINILGNSSQVNVTSTSGTDTVTIGNGSLAAIAGPISISNSSGTTGVTVNDASDAVHHAVTLTSSLVTVQNQTSIALGSHVTGVGFSDSAIGNSFDAESSPSNGFFSIVGRFGDTVSGPAAGQVNLINIFNFPFPFHF